MTTLITSQNYLDGTTVSAKLAAGDFGVSVSPIFALDGIEYQVVLDGHHSLAAALTAGVAPDITVLSSADHDAVAVLERGDIEDFLAVVHMGADYRDAVTGADIW
jgi:hypothetical protein